MADKSTEQGIGETPLISSGGFNTEDRPIRDCIWLVLFYILVLLTLGAGIYGAASVNKDASEVFGEQRYHEDAGYCSEITAASPNGGLTNDIGGETARLLLQAASPASPPAAEDDDAEKTSFADFTFFLKNAWKWILSASAAAVVLGFIFILLFSFFASLMVYTVVFVLFIVPVAVGLVMILIYEDNWGYAFLVVAVIIAVLACCLRSQLNLTAQVLDLGADGIRANLDLVFFSLCTNLALLVVFTALLGFGIASFMNGGFVMNDALDETRFPDACVDKISKVAGDITRDCCDWEVNEWVVWYWVLIVLMAIWSIFLIDQIRVYVVSGVVAQWYFATEENRGNMSIFKSLRYAMGPSFGSLVLSSLILTIANIIHKLSQWLEKKAHEEDAKCKWFFTCLSWTIGCISYIIEWITDFAVVRMSITGESFFTAGRNVVAMMKNNFINAYTVWWFPPIVLKVLSFLISLAASIILALAAHELWDNDEETDNKNSWPWYLWAISFVIIMSVLAFFSALLIDAVNAIFVCFAIDREEQQERNVKAHEVFKSLGMIKEQEEGTSGARP